MTKFRHLLYLVRTFAVSTNQTRPQTLKKGCVFQVYGKGGVNGGGGVNLKKIPFFKDKIRGVNLQVSDENLHDFEIIYNFNSFTPFATPLRTGMQTIYNYKKLKETSDKKSFLS